MLEKKISQAQWARFIRESNHIGILFVDYKGNILDANTFCLNIFKENINNLRGTHINSLIPQRYIKKHEKNFQNFIIDNKKLKDMSCREFVYAQDSQGKEFPVKCMVEKIKDDKEELLAVSIIKAQKTKEELHKDKQTSLLNMAGFMHESYEYLATAYRYNHSFLITYIDLDDLKQINDNFGHKTGDHYINFFVRVLEKNLREQDIFGRIGGDEFIYIAKEIDYKSSLKLIDKICNLTQKENLVVDNTIIPLKFSMGNIHVADYGSKNKKRYNLQELIIMADKTMYTAKQNKSKNLSHVNSSIKTI